MTVILDPGNQAESRVDGLVRPWRTTAGLWKTDYIAEVALYNATAPHVALSGVPNYDIGANGSVTTAGSWTTIGTTTIPRTGNYAMCAECIVGSRSGGGYYATPTGTLRIQVAGATQVTGSSGGLAPDGNTANGACSCWLASGVFTAGQAVAVQALLQDDAAASRTFTGTLHIRFIPEYSNPS